MPWKNSWFQLAALVAVISGGLLIYDFGPGIYSSLIEPTSLPSQVEVPFTTPPPTSVPPVTTPPTQTPVQPASSPASTPPSLPQPATPSPPATPIAGQPWTNSLGMKFVPAGTDNILFCIWDVRVKDFQAFVDATGYDATTGIGVNGTWKSPGFTQAGDHPVVNVSWDNAHAFCDWLTKKEKAEGKLASNQQYRLPTDTEWSNAVGLGDEGSGAPMDKSDKNIGVYPWGTQWPPPSGAGNFDGEDFNKKGIKSYRDGYQYTSPVGSFAPKQYGLYDMGGNVCQWCEEEFTIEGIAGLKVGIVRGSSWLLNVPEKDFQAELLSSRRGECREDTRRSDVGFRVVIVVSPKSGR